MTTHSLATPGQWINTANMRSLGAELKSWMQAVGLVQTADTGQIDWATVTYTATNNFVMGYEIWRFADSSIYFKLEVSTSASNTAVSPAHWFLTVGTGSDGAGNITGSALFPRTNIINMTVNTTNGSSAPSYLCHTDDYFGIVYKVGATNLAPCLMSFAIEKFKDSTGTATGQGFVVTLGKLNAVLSSKRAIRTASPATVFAESTSFCLVPANVTSSLVGSDRQVFLHAFPTPRTIYGECVCTVVTAELPMSTTFSAQLLAGGSSHTYIAIADKMGSGNSALNAATWGLAMLWE